jgi:hypothetical protein
VVDYAWERQSVWSRAADQLKTGSRRQWQLRMILTVAAAVLALAGTQLKPVSAVATYTLAAVAAAVLAGVGLLRGQQDAEQTRRWTQARSVAETIKSEVYIFLARSGEGPSSDREAELEAEVQGLERDARDLLPYTQGVQAGDRPLPEVRDVDSYLEVRIRGSQLEKYYEPKAGQLGTQLRWAKTAEVTLTLMAAAFAAFAAVSPNVGAWAAVVTTAVGAVTAYAASERYEFLWIEYSRTASELRRLYDRHTAADGRRLSGLELVTECEDVISVQNQAWMAKWTEKKKDAGKD